MTREQRQAIGLCTRCGERPLVTKTMCGECRDKRSQINNIRLQRYRDQGLCVCCGNIRLEGSLRCQKCTNNDKAHKMRYKSQGLCVKCGKPAIIGLVSCQEHREKDKTPKRKLVMKQYIALLKRETISYYGGKCACCGESNIQFLTIDHINGGGTKHNKEIGGGGTRLYRWLRDNKYPDGFQVLCFNCNSGRAINNQICPHHGDHRTLPKSTQSRRILREKVFSVYGNKCVCCGENNQLLLTLDHVNGGGKQHAREVNDHKIIYEHAIKDGKSNDYQLLCWNCNNGRSVNGGMCPHKEVNIYV